jgi:bacteriorhodopsin
MQGMDMVSFAQIITIMLSIAEALYFGYNLTINKFKDPVWEPFWVTLVEVICYAVQIGSGSHRFEMADGAMVNIISPTAWCLACPVAMSFMMRISWPEASPRTTLALIMNLEAVLLLGIISGMTANMSLKITLLVCSLVLYLLLFSTLLKGMFYGGVKRPTEAKNILLFFLTTWNLFPIVWILGPSTTGVWSYELSLVFFAFGDIFSKNIFTYIGYKYTMNLLEAEEQLALENGTSTSETSYDACVKPIDSYNKNDAFAKQSNPTIDVDPLLVSRVIREHLQEGSTIRPTNIVNSSNGFVKKFSEGTCMSGIAKDHEESVDFTIVSKTINSLSGGVTNTVICAKNDTNNYPLEFTVVQNDMNEVIFCDLFHSIAYRNDASESVKSFHPSLMPSPRSAGTLSTSNVGISREIFALPMGTSSNPPSRRTSFSSAVSESNGYGSSNDSFAMFPLPQDLGLPIYAWKDGKSTALKILSSKVINLDDGREGNTILAVDANGEMDTFVIVTSVDNFGNRLVMSCKYDQLSLSPSLQNGGLFPSISDSASNVSTRSNMSTSVGA